MPENIDDILKGLTRDNLIDGERLPTIEECVKGIYHPEQLDPGIRPTVLFYLENRPTFVKNLRNICEWEQRLAEKLSKMTDEERRRFDENLKTQLEKIGQTGGDVQPDMIVE